MCLCGKMVFRDPHKFKPSINIVELYINPHKMKEITASLVKSQWHAVCNYLYNNGRKTMVSHQTPLQALPFFEYSPKNELRRQSDIFIKNWQLQFFANAIPDFLLVINSKRQIVFANSKITTFFEKTIDEILGKKPGEILQCVNAERTPQGCGTTEFCKFCGAHKAITFAGRNIANTQECRISTTLEVNALDLRVNANSITIEDETFTILTLTDIGNEKRRAALESIFFHDILNSVGALLGFAELLNGASPEELEEYRPMIYEIAQNLNEEIQSQRQLSAAENHEIAVKPVIINSINLLKSIKESYAHFPIGKMQLISIDTSSEDFECITDEVLLRRVIGNLLKNGLEAVPLQNVTLGCSKNDQTVEFWVHNNSVMSDDVQKQMFQRSFSTKGAGRGLGTYSIRLLTERYLLGKVTFKSDEQNGTIFRVHLPSNIVRNARGSSATILHFSPARV
jgi:K+-sensing histidine kinase KdpD